MEAGVQRASAQERERESGTRLAVLSGVRPQGGRHGPGHRRRFPSALAFITRMGVAAAIAAGPKGMRHAES